MAAPGNRMPLFCALAWHRPRPAARWNHGYYFTKCSRCGVDLVRTAYGRWHEPIGCRVVWQAQAPASAVSASLVSHEAPAPADPGELPIQEVLRHLQNGEAEHDPAPAESEAAADAAVDAAVDAADAAEAAEPAPAPPEMRRIRSVIPDFMDEARPGPSYAYLPRRAPAADPERRDARSGEAPGPGPLERLRAGLAKLFERVRDAGVRLAALPARFRRAQGETEARSEGAAHRPRGLHPAYLAAIPATLLAVAMLALLLWTRTDGTAIEGNGQQSAPLAAMGGQSAFVAASVLNCRSAPAREAEVVAVLMRGDAVQLLARDGDWVSLAEAGGQCWALGRYFSVQQPL